MCSSWAGALMETLQGSQHTMRFNDDGITPAERSFKHGRALHEAKHSGLALLCTLLPIGTFASSFKNLFQVFRGRHGR